MFIKHRIILYPITVIVMLSFSKICYSQLPTFDLDQAYIILDQQNIDIKQARIQLLLSQQDRIDAKNSLLPTLSLGAGHNYNLGLAFDQIAGQLVTGNRWSNNANASVRMNATLFQGFTRSNQIKNALLDIESSELEISRLTKSLRLELLSLYFDAIVNQALHRSSLEQLNYSRAQLDQQQIQFDMGTKTLVDVSLAESQVATDELNVLVSRNTYESKTLDIQRLLDLPYTDSLILATPLFELMPAELSRSLAVTNEPTIQQAQVRIKQAELGLKTAKNGYYPSLSFSSGYGTNYSSERNDYLTGQFMPFWNQVDQNKSLYLGLSLSMPIFDGFKTKSNINRAKLTLDLQKNELDKTLKDQEKILLMARQEYNRSHKEYQVVQTQSLSLKKSFEAMKERYEIGMASSMDYSKALLDYNISEFNLIRAKYNVLYNQEILKVLTDY
ncbi:TolC family protein [Sphingobacterium alkalisoli]|uniref:TolC family protein n=2 Tax=Sphingobacterium alkalisoli TaxID=1874115 RepID=A0A4U0H7J4_9SPHI|nr:TolC family protein [Sphingobacterium alkalisoli]